MSDEETDREESERQDAEARQRSPVEVAVVHKAVLAEGREELARTSPALA